MTKHHVCYWLPLSVALLLLVAAPLPAAGRPHDPSPVRAATWEPRPDNTVPNHTVPPASFHARGYPGMQHREEIFGLVTGRFTGTTDGIFRWAAGKWRLPVDVVRAQAVVESGWHQAAKDRDGRPVPGKGYGDYGSCPAAPGGYGPDGPGSFGVMQVKWCAMNGVGPPSDGGWPWIERSTAFNVDFYGAVMRGCLNGWDTWLGGGYRAGDLWGCVGRWYAGAWHTEDAERYITRVRQVAAQRPWLTW